jgi:predicted  nucleic acid-binding Zn-ribbon protein
MNYESILALENLKEKKKFLEKSKSEIEAIIEEYTYWDIDSDYLDSALAELKEELETVEQRIEEIENSNEYNEQLEYQQKEYRKMQGF